MIGFGLMLAVGIATVTFLIGLLIKWIGEMFLTEREASIAALAMLMGNTIGVLISGISLDFIAISEKVGSFAGFAALWWWLFKRNRAHG